LQGKGHKFEAPLILLNAEKIKAKLRYRSVHLDVLESVSSTNDYLKQFVSKNEKIMVCIAETQTKGRGRLHRSWHSPFGENIYLSMLFPFKKDIGELSGLSLVVGLAVCRAIESAVGIKGDCLKVKWPNDILADRKKLAGILIEIQAEFNGFRQVIIGIGMNVNMEKSSKKNISQLWSSLLKITNKSQNRNNLCAVLINSLIDYLEQFAFGGLSAFRDEWKKRDCLANTTISLRSNKEELQGVCLGINNQGHLLLQTANKGILTLFSGDTTLLR
jgi:BirA family biotin operon repressor/biotin-[acetyl-CoA-carboxylase] ligase